MKILEEYLTFDDVLIKPGFSTIESRETIKTDQNFLGYHLEIPVISANMDYVTGWEMATAMYKNGGLGILHRFDSWENIQANIVRLMANGSPITLSVGTRDLDESMRRLEALKDFINPIICIDVAHGHHQKVVDLVYKIRTKFKNKVSIIAGNVATAEGAWLLASEGVDAVKVGIGPGSVCTTRVVTGVGVPQLSAILEVADALKYSKVKIIADGGIRTSGDIVKALAAGADVVMLGHLLAGSDECPGPVIEVGDGRRYKRYRGQSIFGANEERYTKEGVSGFVDAKGPVSGVIKQLMGGLRSGMSYVGAENLHQLKLYSKFIKVSNHSLQENLPRIIMSY